MSRFSSIPRLGARSALVLHAHVLAITLAVCGGRGGNNPPNPPSQRPPDTRQCTVGKTSRWDQFGFDAILNTPDPRTCPYSAQSPGNSVPYRFYVDQYYNQSYNYCGRYVELKFYTSDRVVRADVGGYLTANGPYNPNRGQQPCRADMAGTYPGGYGTPIRDSVAILPIDPTSPGTLPAQAWAILPGSIQTMNTLLAGPTTVAPGSGATYTARTEWDTSTYTYQWKVDGQLVPGAVGARYLFAPSTVGNYQVAVDVIRADYSVEAVAQLVSVPFTGYLDGPRGIAGDQGGTWQARAPGGAPPYTYAWSVDWSPTYETADTYSGNLGGAGSHYLEVVITDAAGRVTSAADYIAVTQSGTCLEEPCGGYLQSRGTSDSLTGSSARVAPSMRGMLRGGARGPAPNRPTRPVKQGVP